MYWYVPAYDSHDLILVYTSLFWWIMVLFNNGTIWILADLRYSTSNLWYLMIGLSRCSVGKFARKERNLCFIGRKEIYVGSVESLFQSTEIMVVSPKPCVLLIYNTNGWELSCDKHLFAEAATSIPKRWIIPSCCAQPRCSPRPLASSRELCQHWMERSCLDEVMMGEKIRETRGIAAHSRGLAGPVVRRVHSSPVVSSHSESERVTQLNENEWFGE